MSVDERSLAYAYGGAFVVLPEMLDGLFVNHAHTVDEFSAETFVLLLYRGRNLRGFLRVVTDRADLLPIEIFRGCVQEAKLSSWPPEAHIEPQNHLLGLAPRVQKIQRFLNILCEGTFKSSAVARASTWNMSTCRHSTCSVCCGHRNRRWPSHDEGDARFAVRAKVPRERSAM